MTRTLNVFISSKMVELKEERESLYKLIPTLGREGIVLHAWEFETSAPASSDPIREVYLKALKSSALYIGLFWNEYSKPRPGVRAAIKRFIGLFWSKYREPEQPNWTIDEFNRATEERIERHIYVKVVNRRKRDPRLQRFLDKQSKVISGITWKEFKTIEELVESVKRSTDDWLNKLLVSHPGADSAIFASDADDVLERTDIKLIGRDNLVNQVNSLLDQNEQVLLQGFGGMGKTRLAKEVAVQRLANGKGPVLWLRAGDENAETVFAALARPFKRHLEIAHEVGELQIQAVRHLLKESGIKLLVLDDVWNMEALPKVMKAVPRDILMLVTSRNIDSQFRRIEIRKLERQDSLELLGLYAQKNTDKNWIKDINADILCEKVGDSPYLLKVVGKTMSESASTPVDMVQRVESTSLHMLPSAESNNEMVASVIEVSLSMLYMSGQEGKEAHRAFLSFGALFAPSATPELMALVMGENESAVNKMLYELQKLGLADEERKPGESVAYNIHELAYSYARPRSSDEQRGRVLDACLAYMKQHERLSEGDFAALLPMLRNLQGAAKWAFQDKERYAQGKKLTEMLFVGAGRGGILDLLGLASESKELMEMAAQAAAEAKKSEDRRDWQGNQGVGDQQRGDVEQAIEDHEKALNKGLVRKFMDRFLRTSRKIHDLSNEGKTLSNLGIAHRSKGEFEHAIEWLQRALAIHEAINDLQGQADDLTNLGVIYSDLGRFNEAIDYLQQALVLHSTIPDRRGVGADLGNLGIAYKNLGQHDRAIDCYQQALAISREIKDRRAEGNHLGNLGNIYNELGETKQAIDYLEQALVIRREIHDPYGEGADLGNLGIAYKNLGQHQRAIEYYQQSLAIRRQIHDLMGEGKNLGDLGNICYISGQIDQALEYYQQARDIFVKTNVPDMVAQVDRMIARARAKR